jgi:uncharacterized protein YjbI with pentapeptide repeats
MGNPEIKNRFTGAVIIPAGKYSSVKEAVEKSYADLRYADLRSADLRYADLRSANLSSADLSYADLRSANLSSADLSSADLSSADLSSADLSYADLSSANLSSADLSSADLSSADLSYADLRSAKNLVLPHFSHVPEEGSFIAWKKVRDALLKIVIKNGTPRTSCIINRKCRAESVLTIAVYDLQGKKLSDDAVFHGLHNPDCTYQVGHTTKADKWDNNPLVDCTNGIHFFITRKEAEEFNF